MKDIDRSVLVIHPRNEPIVVPVNIEYRGLPHQVGMRIDLLDID
jgi:hypothetical protein